EPVLSVAIGAEHVHARLPGDGQVVLALCTAAMLQLLRGVGPGRLLVLFGSPLVPWHPEGGVFHKHVNARALALAGGDKVEAAYRRGDLFEKRRKWMEACEKFCNTKPAAALAADNVVMPIRRNAGAKEA